MQIGMDCRRQNQETIRKNAFLENDNSWKKKSLQLFSWLNVSELPRGTRTYTHGTVKYACIYWNKYFQL